MGKIKIDWVVEFPIYRKSIPDPAAMGDIANIISLQ
jgi:hypothetical protein